MNAARLSLPGFLTGLLVAFSCTSPDTSGDGSGVPKDEAPEKFAQVLCAAYYSCDCTDHNADPPFSSEENCLLTIEAEAQSDIDAADEEELIYDKECAEQLLDFFDDLDCDTLSALSFEQLAIVAAGLECKVFHGTDDPGDSCESLSTMSDTCVEDALCTNGICVESPRKGPGDACSQGDVCTEGSICIDISGGNDNTCELLPDLGDTCLGAADLCNVGLTCDQETKACAVAPGSGEDCAAAYFDVCAEGLYCDADVCTELPGGGEQCTQRGDCADGFECRAGTCQTAAPMICAYAELAAY